MPVTKEAVAENLTLGDRMCIFSALGLDLAGRKPTDNGWINGLKRPSALGHDRNPSFSVNVQTGAVKDFGSDYTNDLFGFVRDVLRISFPEALEWIGRQIGLPVNGSSHAKTKGSPSTRKTKPEPVSIDDALDWCERLRKGTDAVSEALRRYLMERRGLADETILNRGFGIARAKGRHWLFIPFQSDGECITHYKATAFDVEAGGWLRDRSGKKIVRTCGQVVLYLIDQALEFPDVPLAICEGELDAVLARQHGVNAITGTGGAGTFKDDWVQKIERHPQVQQGVCLLYDGDESGRSGAQKAASKLAAAVSVRVGTLPDGKDISDVILGSGPQALHALIDQAETSEIATEESYKGVDLLIVKSANVWLREANRRPIPRMLFDEFWHEGELCILFADTNIGKTILAVQIADSITSGRSVSGFRLEAQRQPVLYFDFELTDKQFEKRYSVDYQDHYSFDDRFLRVELNPETTFEGDWDKGIQQAIEEMSVSTSAKVLIVDNITYLKNETERAKYALPLMRHLSALKKRHSLSIMALAHTPKRDPHKPITRNDLQGSRTLLQFTDSCFAIGESHLSADLRYLKQIKVRSGEFLYGSNNVVVGRVLARSV